LYLTLTSRESTAAGGRENGPGTVPGGCPLSSPHGYFVTKIRALLLPGKRLPVRPAGARKRANARCHLVPGIGAATAGIIFHGKRSGADRRPRNRPAARVPATCFRGRYES